MNRAYLIGGQWFLVRKIGSHVWIATQRGRGVTTDKSRRAVVAKLWETYG